MRRQAVLLTIAIPLYAAAGVLSSSAFAYESVKVRLSEWSLGFKEVRAKAGEIRFQIKNVGTIPHAFEVEGQSGGKQIEIKSRVLKPGKRTTLKVKLAPGKYEVYCPVHNHRDKGMAGELKVM